MTKQQMWDIGERVIFTAIETASAAGIIVVVKVIAHALGYQLLISDEALGAMIIPALAWLKSLIGVKIGNGTGAIVPQSVENIPATAIPAADVILPEVTTIPEGAGPADPPVNSSPDAGLGILTPDPAGPGVAPDPVLPSTAPVGPAGNVQVADVPNPPADVTAGGGQ